MSGILEQLQTLTVNLSFNKSSAVLPSRFRFLEPDVVASLRLRELSDAGVRIPERVNLADASEKSTSFWCNIAKKY